MDARTFTRRALVGLAVVALVCGCDAGTAVAPSPAPVTAAPAAAASTVTATAAAHWNLVSISDSVFGSGDENHLEAVDAYATGIKRDLGVDVTIHGYWLGGYTSDQVVEKIQGDGALRAQLASADVIVFEVPVGEFRFECPFDNAEWHPLPGTPTEWWTCTARAAARNTANVGRIMDAIVALRSPADALILASNLWEIGYRANLAQGIEPQMHALFTAANAGVEAAAASHGIPVADAWTAFMGPDGTTDPVTTGNLLEDMSHLTAKGALKLASVWRGLGYEKGRTVASRPPAPPSPAASPMPDGTPSAAATGSPSASPHAFGPVSMTNGDVTCDGLSVEQPVVAGDSHSWAVKTSCTVTTNDPRVSGTETSAAWNVTAWGKVAYGMLLEGAGIQSGPLRIENAGGTWVGTGSGIYSTDRGDTVAAWFTGTGGYKGLAYFELRTGTRHGSDTGSIQGLVFPGDPPDLAAVPAHVTATPSPAIPTPGAASLPAVPAPTPAAVSYGPVSVVAGTTIYTAGDNGQPVTRADGRTSYPNGTLAGLETPNDPRVAGTFVASPWRTDVWGHTDDVFGSGIQAGLLRIVNAGGSWDCRVSGLSDNRGNTLVSWCTGAGSYAGLGYFELVRSGNPFIDNPVQGEIFPGKPPTQ